MSTKNQITYRNGWKYQLVKSTEQLLTFASGKDIVTEYVHFYKTGLLWLREGYAWDGPSVSTIGDYTNMRGSVMHDAIYQLMRLGLLHSKYRDMADREFRSMCRKDGICSSRADMYFDDVHLFGGLYAIRQVEVIYTSPRLITDEGVK